jgi:hypothetical protein
MIHYKYRKKILKYIHDFLDKFNYILDVEFASIKEILYPNYWKIGIGITRYEISDMRYYLYPIEYKKEQTLIKEVVFDKNADIMQELFNCNMLYFAVSGDNYEMRNFPLQTAYKGLEDSILGAISKYNFPIADDFIAHEYIISFIDRNHVYLDMDSNLKFYSLRELRYKLFVVLPMLAANSSNFADWVVESWYRFI